MKKLDEGLKKVKVNCTIDPLLKIQFDRLAPLLKTSFSGVLEDAIRKIIEENDPRELLRAEKEELLTKLAENQRNTALAEADTKNYASIKQRALKLENEKDELERERLELLQERADRLRIQINSYGGADWDVIGKAFHFKNPLEAKKWVLSHLDQTNSLAAKETKYENYEEVGFEE